MKGEHPRHELEGGGVTTAVGVVERPCHARLPREVFRDRQRGVRAVGLEIELEAKLGAHGVAGAIPRAVEPLLDAGEERLRSFEIAERDREPRLIELHEDHLVRFDRRGGLLERLLHRLAWRAVRRERARQETVGLRLVARRPDRQRPRVRLHRRAAPDPLRVPRGFDDAVDRGRDRRFALIERLLRAVFVARFHPPDPEERPRGRKTGIDVSRALGELRELVRRVERPKERAELDEHVGVTRTALREREHPHFARRVVGRVLGIKRAVDIDERAVALAQPRAEQRRMAEVLARRRRSG